MPGGALEERAVPHQIFVARFLGVIASPRLDPLGNKAEEGVADIPRPWIEVGSADIGVLKLDVLSDRHILAVAIQASTSVCNSWSVSLIR
jgi:hypothetical protein